MDTFANEDTFIGSYYPLSILIEGLYRCKSVRAARRSDLATTSALSDQLPLSHIVMNLGISLIILGGMAMIWWILPALIVPQI